MSLSHHLLLWLIGCTKGNHVLVLFFCSFFFLFDAHCVNEYGFIYLVFVFLSTCMYIHTVFLDMCARCTYTSLCCSTRKDSCSFFIFFHIDAMHKVIMIAVSCLMTLSFIQFEWIDSNFVIRKKVSEKADGIWCWGFC